MKNHTNPFGGHSKLVFVCLCTHNARTSSWLSIMSCLRLDLRKVAVCAFDSFGQKLWLVSLAILKPMRVMSRNCADRFAH